MSRTSRANVRRRLSLLASSSLVATSMLAGFGGVATTALTPSAALAADVVCSPVASGGTVTGASPPQELCIGSGAGISFTNTSTGTGLQLLLDGADPAVNGVIITSGAGSLTTITDDITPSVIGSTTGDGLHVVASGSAIDVEFTHGATGTTVLSTVANGVYLSNTGAGAITFNTTGEVQGSVLQGIRTVAGTGLTTIGTTALTKGGQEGIYATSGGGDIHITAADATGQSFAGIGSNANGGSIVIKDTGTVSGATAGIDAYTGGAGTIDITAKDSSTTGGAPNFAGVIAGGGTGHINVTTSGVIAGASGVFATGSGAINVNATGGSVTGNGYDGIHTANAGAGAAAVTTINSAATIAAAGDGISAVATGTGTGGGAGANNGIAIATTADIGTSTTAVGADGISAVINNAGNGDNVAVTVGANVFATTTGVNATSNGGGAVTVNATTASTVNAGGAGIIANQTYAGFFGGAATINSTGGGSVNVTGAGANSGGLLARTHGEYNAASVNMTGAAGGSVSVEGAGRNIGIGAQTYDGAGVGRAGSASVTTNAGLSVTVGSKGGDNDFGVYARTNDTYNGHGAAVTLGDNNTISVGSAGAAYTVGVAALQNGGFGAHFSTGSATVTGGANESITVNGASGEGVYALSNGYGAASVTLGDGGHVTVNDSTINGFSYGVGAYSDGGAASIVLGTTSVTTENSTGIIASSRDTFDGANFGTGGTLVTTQGNVNAGLDGIDATTGGTGTVNVNYNTRAGNNATMTAGTAGSGTGITGIRASADSAYGFGKGAVTVNVGNGTGATAIHATNVGISVTGSGAGTVNLANNVTIDPDHIGVNVNVAGTATVTAGNNNTITVTADKTAYTHLIGIYARSGLAADGTSGASVNVSLGTGNTISVGDAAESVGIEGVNLVGGSGSVKIASTGSLNVTATGADSIGVLGQTAGVGNVTIALGAGSIDVNGGASGADTVGAFTRAAGIAGYSLGGNVAITSGEGMDVSNYAAGKTVGIVGTTIGAGNVTIVDTGGNRIYSNNGNGIEGNAVTGEVSIYQEFNTAIFTTNGDGISAHVTGNAGAGNTSIDIGQGGFTEISAANGNGITATITGGGSGNIYVGGGKNGNINGEIIAKAGTSSTGIGIDATTDGHGNITVNQGPNTAAFYGVILSDGVGILAQNTGGKGFGDVSVTANGLITTYGAGSQGVFATSNGDGDIAVTQGVGGSITTLGALADGIKATNTSGFDGGVTVTADGTISATGNGIYASVNTTDGVTVTTGVGSLVNGRLDGISATITGGGSGALNVTADGNIGTAGLPTGFNGIFAESNSQGVVNVSQGVGASIYAGANGIAAYNTSTLNAGDLTVNQAGTIVAGASGIIAELTQTGNDADIDVTSNTITAADDGVDAITFGAGNVTVTANGVINAATGFGITSTAAGGNSTVTTNAAVTGATGISSSTIAGGNSIVTANANVTGTTGDAIDSTAQGGLNIVSVRGTSVITGAVDGINASVTYGALTVNTAAGTDIEAGGDGVHAVASAYGGTVTLNLLGTIGATKAVGGDGVFASTVNTDLGVHVVNLINAAGTGVFATSKYGNVTVTTAPGTLIEAGKDGVNASVTGTGSASVTVTADGNIGTKGTPVGLSGLVATDAGSGSVTVNQGAKSTIYAANVGIFASDSYGGDSGPVTVNQAGTIVSTGDGIYASVTQAGNGANVVVTSNTITSTGVGVLAVTGGTGNVSVITKGTIVAGDYGVAAVAFGGGDTSVSIGGATTGSTGVGAESFGAGTVTVTDTGGFAVTGTKGNGVYAIATGTGTVSVGTSAASPFTGVITGATNGVDATGGGTVNVYTSANVTGGTGVAISATSTGGPVTVISTGGTASGTSGGILATGVGTVLVNNTDVIVTGGARGIDAESTGGNVFVYSDKNITASTTGIFASSTGAGNVTIGSAGDPISGVFRGMHGIGSAGIQAQTQAGSISIDSAADMSTLYTVDFGIEANSTTGGISVTNSGIIDPGPLVGPSVLVHFAAGPFAGSGPSGGSGPRVAGISAISSGLNAAGISIVNSGDIFTSGSSASGIFARNAGTGTVSVVNSGAIDPGLFGIYMLGGGAVVGTNSGPITAGIGIFAETTGAAVGDTVTVSNSGTINATLGDGIDAIGDNGAVLVTSTAPIVAADDGIYAFAGGGGSVTVNASATNTLATATAISAGFDGVDARAYGAGAVTVTTTGDVIGDNGEGILALNKGGGSVTVTTNSQSLPLGTVNEVYGYVAGIAAYSNGKASTTVTANTFVDAGATGTITVDGHTFLGGVGIGAQGGTGGVTINVNQSVYGYGFGIVSYSAGGGTINIAAGARVSNSGYTGEPVVDIVTGTGTGTAAFNTTTLNNAGVISSYSGTPFSDPAIAAAGGNVVVNNSGTIDGTVDFAGLAPGFDSTINNTGTWNTSATSTFGSTANTINNSGTVNVHGTTTFVGAVAFNNTGLISLGGPGVSVAGLSNGLTNDVLLATGTTLNGGAGSTVALDADLSFTTQASCTALTGAADCLALKASTGVTGLLVSDTGAHAVGSFNSGIAVVTGSSGASTFKLDPRSSFFNPALFGGVLDKPGLFFYDLAFSGGTEFLVSAPKPAALAFAAIGGAVSDLWYTTTQTWFDRQADLRDTLSGKPEGNEPAVWLKVIGDWSRRDRTDTFSVMNLNFTVNDNYNQDTAGLIGGVDLLHVDGKNTAFVFGLEGGYVDSDLRFTGTGVTANLTGGTIGAYGTYLAGPLFIDASFNGNFLNMGVGLPDIGVNHAIFDTSDRVNSLGGQVEGGYAVPLGANGFVEPLGLLAYEQTSFDNLFVPGGLEHIDDVSSFRGALGGRLGINIPYQYYKVKLAITGRVWDEFDGTTNTFLTSPGAPDFLFGDNIKGVFGEVQGEANVFEVGNGLSAFLDGGIKFKTRYQEETATLGVRYQW